MIVERLLKEAGFSLDFSVIAIKTPSGKLEVLTIDELMELITFIRDNPDIFGILLEQKWRNIKRRATA